MRGFLPLTPNRDVDNQRKHRNMRKSTLQFSTVLNDFGHKSLLKTPNNIFGLAIIVSKFSVIAWSGTPMETDVRKKSCLIPRKYRRIAYQFVECPATNEGPTPPGKGLNVRRDACIP